MGRKGVSKRKPKALKPIKQEEAASASTSAIASLTKETDAQATRTVARGQAITSGKGGNKKSAQSKTNKRK